MTDLSDAQVGAGRTAGDHCVRSSIGGRQVEGTTLRNRRRDFLSKNIQSTMLRIQIYLWRSAFKIDVVENWVGIGGSG